jgi:hypothetical protein
MFFYSTLLYFLIFSRKYKTLIPHAACHQDLSPHSQPTCTNVSKEKEFNHEDNHTSMAVLLKKYSKKKHNNTTVDNSPPNNHNETTNISTIQKFFRYYQLLQALQSPYLSRQDKLDTIQREQDYFSTSTISPNIKKNLDW